MFRLRSRISISQPSSDRLILRGNPSRRILFGAIAVLLLLAFFMGVDWQNDFTRSSLAGTIFYSALTLTCIGVAIVSRSVAFVPSETKVVMKRTVAGIEIQRSELDLASIEGVTLQSVSFLKEAERPQPGVLNTRFRNYVARRNNYFKLYLDLTGRRHFLEDSTDRAELEQAGSVIADFLAVPFHSEEI